MLDGAVLASVSEREIQRQSVRRLASLGDHPSLPPHTPSNAVEIGSCKEGEKKCLCAIHPIWLIAM